MRDPNPANKNDYPREKLERFGPTSLTDYELLALILRTGGKENSVVTIAQSLLNEFGGLSGLFSATSNQLQLVRYLGSAKIASIKALGELALRSSIPDVAKEVLIKTPEDVFKLLKKDLYMKKRECLYLISLDTRNKLIEKDLISLGTISQTLVSPREVFRQALLRNAVSIILAHNHPSNNPKPSNEDITLTQAIATAGGHIGVALLDHIVICDHTFCSIKALNVFDSN